jgi:hypothetical protein
LEDFDTRVETGTLLTISGYGLEDPDGQFYYEVLNIAETPYQFRSDYELVAGGGGAPDTCTGDSGGPAYLPIDGEMALVGVTSYNFDPQICGGAGAYTLVPAYLDWIETELAAESASSERGGCSCRVDGELSHDHLLVLLVMVFVRRWRNRRC